MLIVTVFLEILKSFSRGARLNSTGASVVMLTSLSSVSSAWVVEDTDGKSTQGTKRPSTTLAQANKILRLDFVLRQNFCFCILYDFLVLFCLHLSQSITYTLLL